MYDQLLESSEFYQKRYHNFSSKIILPTFVLLIFLLTFLAFFKKEITITSQATVEPARVLASIQSTSNNKIKVNNLQENKAIKKDELLVEYDSINESIQSDTVKQQLKNLQEQKKQLELLKLSYENGVSQFPEADVFGYSKRFDDYLSQRQTVSSTIEQQNSTIASQNATSINTQNAIGGAMNNVYQKIGDYETVRTAILSDAAVDISNYGYAIFAAYDTQNLEKLTETEKSALKNQYISQIDTQIQQFQTELSSYEIQYSSSGTQQAYNSSLESQLSSLQSQKISEVSQEITVLDQKITEVNGGVKLQEESLSNTKIVSEVEGIVHVNTEVIDSVIIPEGTIIAQIYPNLKDERVVKVETYIPSKDINTLKIGDKIRFKTQDSSNKEVILNSKISSIDTNATKTKEGSYFKVVSEVKLNEKQIVDLKYGASGNLTVITGSKTYLDYYLDKFLN